MQRVDLSERGFTLTEVLVALVITAFLMVIVLDGSVTARSRLIAAEHKQTAILVADGLVTTARAMPYHPNPQTGVTDGLAWRVDETVESTDRRGVFGLVRIRVQVAGVGGRPAYTAQALRLKAILAQ